MESPVLVDIMVAHTRLVLDECLRYTADSMRREPLSHRSDLLCLAVENMKQWTVEYHRDHHHVNEITQLCRDHTPAWYHAWVSWMTHTHQDDHQRVCIWLYHFYKHVHTSSSCWFMLLSEDFSGLRKMVSNAYVSANRKMELFVAYEVVPDPPQQPPPPQSNSVWYHGYEALMRFVKR